MAAWNKFWGKWFPCFDMFTLEVSVTFLVGIFVAAWYCKLDPLRAMAIRNGFAKAVYLKSKKLRLEFPWIRPAAQPLCNLRPDPSTFVLPFPRLDFKSTPFLATHLSHPVSHSPPAPSGPIDLTSPVISLQYFALPAQTPTPLHLMPAFSHTATVTTPHPPALLVFFSVLRGNPFIEKPNKNIEKPEDCLQVLLRRSKKKRHY